MTQKKITMGFTSARTLQTAGTVRRARNHENCPPIKDFRKLWAAESTSILGNHDGDLDDDLFDLLEENAA